MIKEYIQVDGKDGLVRDPQTDAIISINKSDIEQRRIVKARRKQQQDEIRNLKNEVSEIKGLLLQLLEKK